jgi:thiamine kinase-like enzyme
MADYHIEPTYMMNPRRYPSLEQQITFLRAYAEHGHLIACSDIKDRPLNPIADSAQSFASLLMDSIPQKEVNSESFNELIDNELMGLLEQISDWRACSHTHWCCWGILMNDESDPPEGEEKEEFFDYFGYADQRMRLFFGEMKRMGLIDREEEQGLLSAKDYLIIE